MNDEEFAELAAGHALRALSVEDEGRFQRALSAHPEWAARVYEDAETAAALADALAPVTPPPALRDRLLASIAEPPQREAESGSTDRPDAGAPVKQRGWSRGLFALAASLVLLVALGVGAVVAIPQLLRPEAVSALEQIRSAEDARQATIELPSGGEATAHWSATLGDVVLVTSGLEALDEEQTYELWYVRGEAPVAAGTFRPEDGRATALLEGAMQEGDVIAVTVEAAGGSPNGQPTSNPIIVIPTA
ncbi:anti-sigma factor domain-containing protein [Microbacterium sp. NPDC058342]|uniref:anti-sigma factor n=1 Tax=Microbacterium sp. NPDC058342 TaxID=3346454 RepID=UPI003660945F